MKLRKFFWYSLAWFGVLAILASFVFYVFEYNTEWTLPVKILATTSITLSLAIFFSFRVASNLENLRDRVKRVAVGELDEVVDFSRNEVLEIQEIARGMDDISAELHRRIDVIQRQKEELEAVLTSMDEGLVAVDKHHHITHFNPSAAKMFKAHRDIAIDRKLEEVIRLPELHRVVEEGMESGKGNEVDILTTGDTKNYLRVHSSPLRNQFGHQYGVVLVVSDVTRIRQLEGMRKNFVANVSHELRTPLTSIQGFAETLADPNFNDEEQSRKYIGIINKHAARLARIIDDILTLSRIEKDAEDAQMELKPESSKSIVETAVELCQMKAKKKNMTLNLDIQCDETVNCDRYLIEQSIVNLIDNAIRYSDEGGKVELSCSSGDGNIYIDVQDFGMGIAERQLGKIFERFYRVDRARSRELGGTGLGLSIVKHIAQAHHGNITVDSKVGQGSSFRLSLPIFAN